MRGNYKEVNVETQKVIVTCMSTMPKESVLPEKASPMPKESKESAQTKETSPTEVSSPHSFTPVPSDSPHITISSESMQVDDTNVTIDKTEDPFKDIGFNIVGNIVDYNSSSDEEKGQEPKEEDAPSKKIESSIEVATSSVPLVKIVVTPVIT